MADEETDYQRIARDMKHIRRMLEDLSFAQREAESEVPEKIRRFTMYMHDIHSIVGMYEERGHQAPAHVLREVERCDDRYRHLLEDLHTDGGAFEKVRRDMAEREGNRWDHTRQLTMEKKDETRTVNQPDGSDKSRTEVAGD